MMAPQEKRSGFFGRLFGHPHFHSLGSWRIDFLVCFVIAALVTPADPYSLLLVAIPLSIVWMTIRYFIARRHAKSLP